jgi:hypothetical protein
MGEPLSLFWPRFMVRTALSTPSLGDALTWRDRKQELRVVATHDAALALAARAFGFEVLGVSS